MFKVLVEILTKFRDKWIESRLEKPWKENLFLIPYFIAAALVIIAVFNYIFF